MNLDLPLIFDFLMCVAVLAYIVVLTHLAGNGAGDADVAQAAPAAQTVKGGAA